MFPPDPYDYPGAYRLYPMVIRIFTVNVSKLLQNFSEGVKRLGANDGVPVVETEGGNTGNLLLHGCLLGLQQFLFVLSAPDRFSHFSLVQLHFRRDRSQYVKIADIQPV